MGAWEELAKKEYERLNPNAKFDSLNSAMRHRAIENVKEKVAHRLYYLTGISYGSKHFCPIFYDIDVYIDEEEDPPAFKYGKNDHSDAKEREALEDWWKKRWKKKEKLKRDLVDLQNKKKKLEQEIINQKGRLKEITQERIKEVERDLKNTLDKYDSCIGEEEYYDHCMGIETKRFAELNDLEKELFGILLREIRQKDLEKARHDRWECFDLDVRNKIIELLNELCDQEQWQFAGTIEENLDMSEIRVKLSCPKEYRLFKLAVMIMSRENEIPQKTKDDILEIIDDSILKAYKMLRESLRDEKEPDVKGKEETKNLEEQVEAMIREASRKK